MKLTRLLLAVSLLVLSGCDPDVDNIRLDLGSELLTVNVSTVGANLDPDGYTLSVTGQLDDSIGINATRTYSVLAMNHTITLSGVADNCTVADNPRTISVTGSTVTTFVVECS